MGTFRHRGHCVMVGEHGPRVKGFTSSWTRTLAPLPAKHVEAADVAIDHRHRRRRVKVNVTTPKRSLADRIVPAFIRKRRQRAEATLLMGRE